jgi:hypothetical protein
MPGMPGAAAAPGAAPPPGAPGGGWGPPPADPMQAHMAAAAAAAAAAATGAAWRPAVVSNAPNHCTVFVGFEAPPQFDLAARIRGPGRCHGMNLDPFYFAWL